MTIAGLVWSTSRLNSDSEIILTLFLRLAYAMQRFRKMLMIVFIVVCCYWFLLLIYTAESVKCYKKIIIISSFFQVFGRVRELGGHQTRTPCRQIQISPRTLPRHLPYIHPSTLPLDFPSRCL